jgi:hypothetical protein
MLNYKKVRGFLMLNYKKVRGFCLILVAVPQSGCLIREKVVTFRMVKLNMLLSIFLITK